MPGFRCLFAYYSPILKPTVSVLHFLSRPLCIYHSAIMSGLLLLASTFKPSNLYLYFTYVKSRILLTAPFYFLPFILYQLMTSLGIQRLNQC